MRSSTVYTGISEIHNSRDASCLSIQSIDHNTPRFLSLPRNDSWHRNKRLQSNKPSADKHTQSGPYGSRETTSNSIILSTSLNLKIDLRYLHNDPDSSVPLWQPTRTVSTSNNCKGNSNNKSILPSTSAQVGLIPNSSDTIQR